MSVLTCFGECMIELNEAASPGGAVRRGFGGDTLNTAVYAARVLVDLSGDGAAPPRVRYLTALGDDPFSAEMIAAWRAEGLDTDAVAILPGRLPGLYAIRTDATGERSFYYWRDRAAARDVMRTGGIDRRFAALGDGDTIYLTGISIAILPADDRGMLLDLLAAARSRGAAVAFDPNYRPQLWPSAATARDWMDRFFALSTIALPGFDDDSRLFGSRTPEEAAARLRNAGVTEVAVKNGADSCLLAAAGEAPVEAPGRPAGEPVVDTTAAGDSFNGAYLAARLTGRPPAEAARLGHALAARVILHRGAIIPGTAMKGWCE